MKIGKGATHSLETGRWQHTSWKQEKKPGNREVETLLMETGKEAWKQRGGNTPHENRKRSLETERWQHSSWKQ
jgi:hypothetical protein